MKHTETTTTIQNLPRTIPARRQGWGWVEVYDTPNADDAVAVAQAVCPRGYVIDTSRDHAFGATQKVFTDIIEWYPARQCWIVTMTSKAERNRMACS